MNAKFKRVTTYVQEHKTFFAYMAGAVVATATYVVIENINQHDTTYLAVTDEQTARLVSENVGLLFRAKDVDYMVIARHIIEE
jgi:hypothetical protein